MNIIFAALVATVMGCAMTNPALARITRIVIDETVPMPIALAPAIRNSIASSAVQIPPWPMMGIECARAT